MDNCTFKQQNMHCSVKCHVHKKLLLENNLQAYLYISMPNHATPQILMNSKLMLIIHMRIFHRETLVNGWFFERHIQDVNCSEKALTKKALLCMTFVNCMSAYINCASVAANTYRGYEHVGAFGQVQLNVQGKKLLQNMQCFRV